MAGGPHAAVATCIECAGPADRTSEGLETDYYKCRECGSGFGICFDEDIGGGGPPDKPLYPPTPEEAEAIRKMAAERKKKS